MAFQARDLERVTSEQDARTTIFSRFHIIQFSCTSAYSLLATCYLLLTTRYSLLATRYSPHLIPIPLPLWQGGATDTLKNTANY